jgi:hypothetical protein
VQIELKVPYRDTTADDLVWRLGEPPCAALATLKLAVPGGQLELRLLGSSHQVIFAAGGTVISEVVACADTTDANRDRLHFDSGNRSHPQPVALPAAVGRALPGGDYRFRSATHRLAPDRFGYWVDGLVDRLAEHPAAIVGRFPGSPHAVTALLAGEAAGSGAGLRWRTWHAYPQDGRLVATSTVVQPHGELAR